MSFCGNCGAKIDDNVNYCPTCGRPVGSGAAKPRQEGGYDENDIVQNKAMAILSYISLLALIPLFACKESPYAQFHAKQGTNLLIIEGIYCVAHSIIKIVFWALSPVLGVIMEAILGLGYVGFAVFSILGIVYAAQGQATELPLIGKLKFIK